MNSLPNNLINAPRSSRVSYIFYSSKDANHEPSALCGLLRGSRHRLPNHDQSVVQTQLPL